MNDIVIALTEALDWSKFWSHIDALIFSVAFAFLLKFTYTKFSRDISDREKFSAILVLLAVTTTVIIQVIKGSLSLSIGLIGALSIVRFRSPIKDPEQLVYLFAAIAIGIGAGAGETVFTGIATVFLCLLIIAISSVGIFRPAKPDVQVGTLVATILLPPGQAMPLNEIEAFLHSKGAQYVVKRTASGRDETSLTIQFYNASIREADQYVTEMKSTAQILPSETEHELFNMSASQLSD